MKIMVMDLLIEINWRKPLRNIIDMHFSVNTNRQYSMVGIFLCKIERGNVLG